MVYTFITYMSFLRITSLTVVIWYISRPIISLNWWCKWTNMCFFYFWNSKVWLTPLWNGPWILIGNHSYSLNSISSVALEMICLSPKEWNSQTDAEGAIKHVCLQYHCSGVRRRQLCQVLEWYQKLYLRYFVLTVMLDQNKKN